MSKTLKDMSSFGDMDKLTKAELLKIIKQKNDQLNRLQRGSQALNGSVKRLSVDIVFLKDQALQLNKTNIEARHVLTSSLGLVLRLHKV